MKRALLALGLLFGCGGDNGGDDREATDSTPAGEVTAVMSTDGEECILGEERCECNGGQCLAGLTCASNVCVSLPQDPGDDDGDDGDGSGSTGDPTNGPTPCNSTANCSTPEICFENVGECHDPWEAESFLLSIPSADICPADGAGGAEVYYDVKIDDALVFSSAVSGCPAGWGNESFELTDFQGSLSIEFWESDAFFDDFITSLCWDTLDDGECGPMPRSILHDGGWSGSFGAEGAYSAELVLEFLQ